MPPKMAAVWVCLWPVLGGLVPPAHSQGQLPAPRPAGLGSPSREPLLGQSPGGAAEPWVCETTAPLGIEELEGTALRNNPTLAQAAAQVEESRGRAIQAGLLPNPTIGYAGEQMGAQGTAGERQGAYVNQLIPLGGKFRLSRAKFNQEAVVMQWQAKAQQYRVLNGVRMNYFKVLAFCGCDEVRANLLKVAEDALLTTKELVNVGQANRADVLQADIEADDHASLWRIRVPSTRRLAGTGSPGRKPRPAAGPAEREP